MTPYVGFPTYGAVGELQLQVRTLVQRSTVGALAGVPSRIATVSAAVQSGCCRVRYARVCSDVYVGFSFVGHCHGTEELIFLTQEVDHTCGYLTTGMCARF